MSDSDGRVAGYSPESWTDLFVASAGASAALTGLLFVAVSLNIKEILGNPGLPGRALQTLLLLLSTVVVSLVGLIPGQSVTALGVELLILGLSSAGGCSCSLRGRWSTRDRTSTRPSTSGP